MNVQRRLTLLGAALVALAAGVAAAADSLSSIKLKSARTDLLVNESTLVTLTSSDPLAANPTVTWSTTFGKITPIRQGDKDYSSDVPSALFTSERAGTATISASLLKGDGNRLSDSIQITVNPLRAAP
jgi:hypothetical protein